MSKHLIHHIILKQCTSGIYFSCVNYVYIKWNTIIKCQILHT